MERAAHRTWLEIDLGRIKKNYTEVMSRLGAEAQAIAVVKADAYGHGASRVAAALYDCGVRRFAVADVDEAVALRESGAVPDKCEILILGYTPPALAGELAAYGLTQTLISEDYARELYERGVMLRTQLAVDSGMHRLGVPIEDTESVKGVLQRFGARLGIAAVFTHLCCADSEEDGDCDYTKWQLCRFASLYGSLSPYGIKEAHCLNSAGILYHSGVTDASLKALVRPGIALYGYPPRIGDTSSALRPALSWKTVIASVKKIRRGEPVGYGRSFIAPRDMKIAILPVGYADGYPRALSGIGTALTDGCYAPVVGRVCMNQMTVDVSACAFAMPGDEVTLIGGGRSSAEHLAELTGTISYEIISRIYKSIPRIYKDV